MPPLPYMFQQDRAGKSENFVDPEERIEGRSKNRAGRPKTSRKGQEGQNSSRNKGSQNQSKNLKKGQRSRKGRKSQFKGKNLEILEETDLAKVIENLHVEIKRFNKELEKLQLEGQKPEKFKERIKEGRVLPPLLRSLQLLLQR